MRIFFNEIYILVLRINKFCKINKYSNVLLGPKLLWKVAKRQNSDAMNKLCLVLKKTKNITSSDYLKKYTFHLPQ